MMTSTEGYKIKDIDITEEDIQKVIDSCVDFTQSSTNGSHVIKSITSLDHKRASDSLSYVVALSDGPAYLLLVSQKQPANTIPLAALNSLLQLAQQTTSVPFPHLVSSSTDCTIIPYHYTLFTLPDNFSLSNSLENRRAGLAEQQIARIEMELGVCLKQLHGLQNDWFGKPKASSPAGFAPSAFSFLSNPGGEEPVYSWQEAFTPMVEELLDELQKLYPTLAPWSTLRLCLGRAVGFYLFDDAEVPCLISGRVLTDSTVFIIDTEHAGQGQSEIVSILPTIFLESVWGDPLLEPMLLPPGPSKAVLEAYTGGVPLVLFPRQKTKRLWYALYHAGAQLLLGSEDVREQIVEIAEKLKHAPCY